jgi:hypothetical protein
VLALLVGLVLLLLLPHPWNGVGVAAAMTWEIVTILYCLLAAYPAEAHVLSSGTNAEEDSGLHYLSQHASVISGGAALVSVVLVRSLLRMFMVTLILGGMGALAYLVILRH